MKRRFLVFFSIVLGVHFLANFYIGLRGWQSLEMYPEARPFFLVGFILIVFSYLLGQILERKAPGIIGTTLVWMGGFWFAFMLYFLISIVLVDLGRAVQYFAHILPAQPPAEYMQTKFLGALAVTAVVSLIVAVGHYKATHIHVKRLELSINKPSEIDSLNIVMMSDQHLGSIIGRSRMKKMVAQVNALKPDIVLLAGDEIDGNPEPVVKANLGEFFEQIQAPLGVFAITGNHEYIGNVEKACSYLNAHGVRMLRDEVAVVKGIQIVGREDLSAKQDGPHGRKSIDAVMSGVDRKKPIILLDHQPFHLEEAEQAGVDLQLSGHTHHAQLWPLSYITKRVYEVSWGYKQKGNTHYYVSCGVGTWGPPVRIGSHSEIVNIRLRFGGEEG